MSFQILLACLCKVGIGVILLGSLFSKGGSSLLEVDESSIIQKRITSFVELLHAPYVIATVYFLLNGKAAVAIALLAVMVGIGISLKYLWKIGRCNCYGLLTNGEGHRDGWFTASLVAMCAVLLFGTPELQSSGSWVDQGVVLFPLTLLLSVLVAIVLRSRRADAGGEVGRSIAIGSSLGHQELEGLLVGLEANGESVYLGEIAATCPMIAFFVLSSGCPTCEALKPAVFPIANLFAGKLRTVFLVDDLSSFEEYRDDAFILKGDVAFTSWLGGDKLPFGVLVDSRSLSVVGSVAYGVEMGSLILRSLSVALRKRGPRGSAGSLLEQQRVMGDATQ